MAAKQCQPENRVHVFDDDAPTCVCGAEKQTGGTISYSTGLKKSKEPAEDTPERVIERAVYGTGEGYEPEAREIERQIRDSEEVAGFFAEQEKQLQRIEADLLTTKINPQHYDGDACMHAIAACGFAVGGCLGTAMKYLWRAGRKSGESLAADVGKARWYLDWLKANVHKNSITYRNHLISDRLYNLCALAANGEDVREQLAALSKELD